MSDSGTELKKNFERFVREDIEKLAVQEDRWFDEAAENETSKCVLYGFGSLGRLLLKGLRTLNLEPVAIVDSKLSSEKTQIEGIPCLEPEEACAAYGKDSVFIVSVFNQSGDKAFAHIKTALNAMGVLRVIYFLPFLWKHAPTFLPYYSLDLPSKLLGRQDDILRVYDLFADRQSKSDYAAFVYHLICPEPASSYQATNDDTYFPSGVVELSENEAFLDGGAFNGDTLAAFLQRTDGKFSKYIGVEPDPKNLEALRERIANLPPRIRAAVETRSSAIGFEAGELRFAAGGHLGSALGPSGNLMVPVSPLAQLLDGAIPTFVKLDIEGAELDALSGAAALLRGAKPKLAVCVYHCQDHFWRIPMLINQISSDYQLFFRRHREYLDDIVAYAIPA